MIDYPELDEYGYPTEETIDTIRNWRGNNYHDLMNYVIPIFDDYGNVDVEGDIYKFSTGGWSGCEDAILALKENILFWAICWRLSKRGGYFEFEVKTLL